MIYILFKHFIITFCSIIFNFRLAFNSYYIYFFTKNKTKFLIYLADELRVPQYKYVILMLVKLFFIYQNYDILSEIIYIKQYLFEFMDDFIDDPNTTRIEFKEWVEVEKENNTIQKDPFYIEKFLTKCILSFLIYLIFDIYIEPDKD